ncbi:MAG: CocE/NonD family hydrolase, partial [Pseudomonadota bacterium]
MQPCAKWQLPPEQDYEVVEHIWIPMQDGVRLSVRLWIPESASKQPAPIVLEYIPYRKRDLYRFHDSAWGKALASRGIAFARIDVRGSGDSEGVMTDEYSEAEIADGMQCIEWLSQQDW